MGLPRERRLRRRADFVRIQSAGRRVTTPHFTLLVAVQPVALPPPAPATAPAPASPTPARGPGRLGLVVTRKIGNAVARNRIKRVCRACFATWAPPGFVPDGVDLVVIARAGADALGLAAVRTEWSKVEGLVRKRAEEALARG